MLKPTLYATLQHVFATQPGAPLTAAELTEGAEYHGYLYPSGCDTPDKKVAHTRTVLANLVTRGAAEETTADGVRFWHTRPTGRPAPVEPAPVVLPRRAAAQPRPPQWSRPRAGQVRSLQNPATATLFDLWFAEVDRRVARVTGKLRALNTQRARLTRRERGTLTTFVILCVATVSVILAAITTS